MGLPEPQKKTFTMAKKKRHIAFNPRNNRICIRPLLHTTAQKRKEKRKKASPSRNSQRNRADFLKGIPSAARRWGWRKAFLVSTFTMHLAALLAAACNRDLRFCTSHVRRRREGEGERGLFWWDEPSKGQTLGRTKQIGQCEFGTSSYGL